MFPGVIFFVFAVLFVELGLSFLLSALPPRKARWVLLACKGRVRAQEKIPNRLVNTIVFFFYFRDTSRVARGASGPTHPEVTLRLCAMSDTEKGAHPGCWWPGFADEIPHTVQKKGAA